MAKRSVTTQELNEELRRELLQVLDVHDTATLVEFANEAMNSGEWKRDDKSRDSSGALSSLHYLLGGGGCVTAKREALRQVLNRWVESGRVTPQPASRGRVDARNRPLTLAQIAAAVAAADPKLGIVQVVNIAERIQGQMGGK